MVDAGPTGSGGSLQLQPPPALAPGDGLGSLLMNLVPMLGSLGSIVLVATMPGQGGSGRQYVSAGMFLFASLGFVLVQVSQQRRQRQQSVTVSRAGYLRYLAGVRQKVREAADQQRHALTSQHPDPSSLPAIASERSRLWERGPGHARFLQVRYGVCRQRLALELFPPEDSSTHEADPACESALQGLLAVHRLQPDLPATVDLRSVDRVEICGTPERARAAARSLVCEATAFHSPEQLVVAVLTDDASHWDWVKWLPHVQSTRASDAVGPRRMVATSRDALADLLPAQPAPQTSTPHSPHLLLLVDGVAVPPDGPLVPRHDAVTVIDVRPRPGDLTGVGQVRLELEESHGALTPALVARPREDVVPAKVDQCDLATAEAFARRLAPLHAPAPVAPGSHGRGPTDLLGLLGLGEVRSLDPQVAWRPRSARERLRVPIGVADDGSPVHLDLKESAHQGMGPHGLVIGATGSGKSELLRSLVLGLTLTHPPDQLNLVLVDFKGGATFAGLSPLPHVSALITNLAQELALVERMQDALVGEMTRRQEMLRAAGNLTNVEDYERARRSRPGMAPMPSLLVVVDEFSELLSAKPELIDLFVAIGRLGRSLGIHLLLASQRLEEGRLRGLESHLSYRVGLRTFSAHESRAVLGVPDAYELPAVPGLGYLKPDPASLVRFRAAYVSAPPTPSVPPSPRGVQAILPFTVAEVRAPATAGPAVPPAVPAAVRDGTPRSVLDIAVERMRGHGVPAHPVWLPPLDAPATLDRLMPLTCAPGRGLASPPWRSLGPLVVPLGVVDKPREQRRDPLSVDLSGAAGHVAVVGGPRSGKSTLLRTLVASTALTSTPLETQFFVLDFGGGTFAPLARLPHVAGVGSRSESDVVRRVVAQVRGVLDRREARFREHGIDSIETYRARRASGGADAADAADDGYGDVFLVIDGWGTLRADFAELEPEIQQLAGRGLAFGVHLVASAARWSDFRAGVRDLFGTRLELRLGEPMDSEVDRRLAALVPSDRPGRGILPGGLHFLAALPRIDGLCDAGSLGDGVERLVRRVAATWDGPAGPKLRLLPEHLSLSTLRERADLTSRHLWIGLNEADLAPVGLDVDAEPHLLVYGDGGSGKSSLLRNLAREIVRTRSATEAQLVVVDYRRTLLGEVPADHLLSHLTSSGQAAPALADLAAYLESRIPGADVTPDQLRDRSWWQGAEVFVLVDDYDLVATPQGSPLHALQPLLAQARDVGLHLVVARRTGGAARASYDPVIQAMRDLAQPGILLAGSPEEGALIGPMRPTPAQPGRGRLLTRERGIEVVQLAQVDRET